jgi:DNA (cytosine-5)-methyltransferase 1
MKILDLFSGIGGFHLGFKRAGFKFDYVGFSEIDKYASAVYKYNNPFAEELGDVKSIRSENLPKIDIITFGSPCQDFSLAGARAGMSKGTRSSLIWEAIRLIDECKPHFFIWENVKGTFSSNDGRDFWAIIQAFTNIGSYRLEWQLLNTRWFPRTPQNRERIYLVGYSGNRGRRSVFPIREYGGIYNDKQIGKDLIQTFTERSFDGNREDGGRSIRYHKILGETPCLSSNMGTGGNNVPMIKFNYGQKSLNETLEKVNLKNDDIKVLDLYNKKAQDISPTLTEPHHNSLRLYNKTKIRKLTPVECMRLQGFPDNHNQFGLLDGKKVAISDTQRYKQAGNAVTVDVVEAVARRIKKIL